MKQKEKELDAQTISRVYGKILNLLSYRRRSGRELKEKLRKYISREKNVDKKVMEKYLFQRLEGAGYVDDKKFAQDLVEVISNSSKPKSILYIKRKLSEKGVSSSIINDSLQTLDKDFEYKSALKDIQKKASLLKNTNTFIKQQKIKKYLYGKGYSSDAIYKTLTQLEV